MSLLVINCWAASTAQAVPWRELEKGLSLSTFPACQEMTAGRDPITAVRLDPAGYELVLLRPQDHGPGPLKPMQELARQQGLVLATNAGMYSETADQSGSGKMLYRHIGYLKYLGQVENGRRLSDYKSVLAFHPRRRSLPAAALADLEKTTLDKLDGDYHSLLQNLRMIGHKRRNVWPKSQRHFTIAALAADPTGKLLFIFSGSAYAVHDFNRCLLALPLKIARAQYLEGGKEASLILRTAQVNLDLIGAPEAIFGTETRSDQPWPIPYILGVKRRASTAPPVK